MIANGEEVPVQRRLFFGLRSKRESCCLPVSAYITFEKFALTRTQLYFHNLHENNCK